MILLAIGLTFYAVSQMQFNASTNLRNAVRAELTAEAGTAIAVGFLNHDLAVHPTVTSTDFAPSTYFNGACFIGKPLGLGPAFGEGFPIQFDPTTFPTIAFDDVDDDGDGWVDEGPAMGGDGIDNDRDGLIDEADEQAAALVEPAEETELLFFGEDTKDWLYIPRNDNVSGPPPAYVAAYSDLFARPFVIDLVGGDGVDNDGDGFIDEDPTTNMGADGADNDGDGAIDEFDERFYEAVSVAEQIDTWADVDNNGDGYKDSVWLPMPADRFFLNDGLDNDLDGWVDEGPYMLSDGLDNDGDGWIDEGPGMDADGKDNDGANGVDDPGETEPGSDGVDNDGDGDIDEFDEQMGWDGLDNDGDGSIDEADEHTEAQTAETAPLAYWGGNDGLDNNGNNPAWETDGFDNDGDGITDEPREGIDEPDEQRVFLTAPLLAPDGSPLSTAGFDVGHVVSILEDYAGMSSALFAPGPYTVAAPADPHIDVLDNDWSLFINDHEEYAGPDASAANLPAQAIGLQRIHAADYPGAMDYMYDYFGTGNVTPGAVYATGEPVCELVGRIAVLITDESSKVNLNVAGGRAYHEERELDPNLPPLVHAFNEGVSTWEYDTRVLPSIGVARSDSLWAFLTGAPDATHLETDSLVAAPADDARAFDVSLPGHGRADETGDALWLAMNGLDDDGDGIIDEGLNPLYPEYFGMFEGTDEPQELRWFRPLRNLYFEQDGFDNDGNEAFDELGELGDQHLKTRDQVKEVSGIRTATADDLRNVTSVHATDKNNRYRYEDDEGRLLPLRDIDRANANLRLDYAYAAGDKISQAFQEDWAFLPTTLPTENTAGDPVVWPPDDEDQAFFRGLRQATTNVIVPAEDLDADGISDNPGIMGGLYTEEPDPPGVPVEIPADDRLRADQLAANVKDFGDADHARSQVPTSVEDTWWDRMWAFAEELATGVPQDPNNNPYKEQIEYTASGIEDIRINEIMARPV
ncbi:MAG TPA: hypothetical protein HPP77_03155, partial [Candidatus Hydrogenedentes bacterium]|nr:hypothetical protein [Candidatus Hydrogenedentota bacterium]